MLYKTFRKKMTVALGDHLEIDGKVNINSTNGGYLYVDGSLIAASEFTFFDGVTAGQALASKAVVLGSAKEIATITTATITNITNTTLTATTINESGLLTLSGNTGINFTGTAITKGINFASASAVMSDADDAFISYGTWNDAVVVGARTAHFVPFQVHMHSNEAHTSDIAAMRLRVDTAATSTGTAHQVLQIRQDIGHNVGSVGTMGAGLTISAASAVGVGEVVCGGFSIAGAYKATPSSGSNKVTVLQACNWSTYAGTSTNYIFDAYQNGAGNTVDAILRGNVIAGTATNGLQIVNTSGTLTYGISVTNATLGATDERAIKVSTSQAAPAMADGYGVVEIDHTISGTVAGYACASSTWVNVPASTVCGSNMVCTRNDGIWVSATGTPMASATAIIGGRFHYVAEGGGNPGALYLFSTNISSNALTAMFHVNAAVDIAWGSGAYAGGTAGHFPIFRDVTAGVTHYINTYTAES